MNYKFSKSGYWIIAGFFILTTALSACQNKDSQKARGKQQVSQEESKAELYSELRNEYAEHFAIRRYEHYEQLIIWTDFEHQDSVIFNVDEALERIAVVSTTHAAFFSALQQRHRITALSWLDNYYDDSIRSMIDEGGIMEIASQMDLNHELIVQLQPDLVLTYLTADPDYGDFKKLKELGLDVLPIAEFRETHPLGQLEWIKVFGCLTGQLDQSEEYFLKVKKDYLQMRDNLAAWIVAEGRPKPKVLTGMPWQGNWTLPQADAFAAQYLKDAGMDYPWNDSPGSGSISLDFEAIFVKAHDCDLWLNPGAARTLGDIEAVNSKLRNFDAFKQERVWNNDLRINANGGNDYWESAICRPDLVLADLVRIAHPEYVSEGAGKFTYYRSLRP